jgi:hypothetical protein
MDLHLKILELGLDAKTWVDYILQQTRDSMQHEPSSLELSDIAAGVERLEEKVQALKELLADYVSRPVPAGPRRYPTLEAARETFLADDEYSGETMLGKYYAVGTPEDGYDIQFLTGELCDRTGREHPDWQVVELKKG